MSVDKPEKDTVPASRAARERQTSGVHQQVNEPPVSGERIHITDDEAHAEMDRAVLRGDCAVLTETELDGGMFRQQSAWFTPDQRLVIDAWYRSPRGTWTRGTSLLIGAEGVPLLAEFLERRGGGKP